MGKRKFRLKSVKNYERNKYKRKVLSEGLKVSIPLHIYTTAVVSDASTLHARLCSPGSVLPTGWDILECEESESTLFSLTQNCPNTSSHNNSTVYISLDCTWYWRQTTRNTPMSSIWYQDGLSRKGSETTIKIR